MCIMAQLGINYKDAEALHVLPEHLDEHWEVIKPIVEKWLPSCNGEFDIDDVYAMLKDKRFALLAFHTHGDIRLVALMEFVQYPKKRVLRFVGFAGENPIVAFKFLPAVEAWALRNHATELESLVSDDAVKYVARMGFAPTYTMMRKVL